MKGYNGNFNTGQDDEPEGAHENLSPADVCKFKPVFTTCNVCGRTLVRKDELAAGMCAICANEEL
jgi:hypothetical protein